MNPPPGIEAHPIDQTHGRDHWLALRRRDITASVVACLLRHPDGSPVHEHTTAYQQWVIHTGRLAPDQEESEAMERGSLMEMVAAPLLRRRQPTWTVKYPVGFYYRDPITRTGCTPDIFAFDPARGTGSIQVKSVAAKVYREKWCLPSDTGEKTVEPPLWITVQALQEAALTGVSWCAVAPLVIDDFGRLTMPLIDIPIHAGLMAKLRTRVAEFWDMVESGTAPPPDYARDGEAIAQIYGSDGRTIDLSGENELPTILDEDERLREQVKVAEERRGAIKAQVRHKLAGATFGYCNGWQITNKEQSRSGHYVKPSTFAVLRAKRNFKEKAYVASGSF